MLPTIGIDLTGGDATPETLFEGLVKAPLRPNLRLVFFVPELHLKALEALLSKHPLDCQISFVKAEDTITKEDNPLSSIRLKKNSPMMTALRQLKEGDLDALVSIGNTGALLSGSTLILKKIKSIKRPGLLAILPTMAHPLVVIDVGANVSCSALHLAQFAQIGIAYQKCLGITHPKVGLLNIGSEKEKGRKEMRDAYKKLEALNTTSKTFLGNIEGKEAFKGCVDVLVTDGFSGNVFLKTAEGMTAFILSKLLELHPTSATQTPYRELKHLLDYSEYPGALICGIEGIVIKCHGYSNSQAIYQGIQGAIHLVESQFLQKLKNQLKI